MNYNNLIAVAKEASKNAFALKSEHHIGACVTTKDGQVFGGCNIEANISGLGICAERNAINHAIMHGKYFFDTLVTYSEGKPIKPCGACLQYLSEFTALVDEDITIICAGTDSKEIYKFKKLLPNAYVGKKAKEKIREYVSNL